MAGRGARGPAMDAERAPAPAAGAALDKNVAELTVTDVYDIAALVGHEFERLIDQHGCEAIARLMPKVVRVLEILEVLVSRRHAAPGPDELRLELDRLRLERAHRLEKEREHQKVRAGPGAGRAGTRRRPAPLCAPGGGGRRGDPAASGSPVLRGTGEAGTRPAGAGGGPRPLLPSLGHLAPASPGSRAALCSGICAPLTVAAWPRARDSSSLRFNSLARQTATVTGPAWRG